LIFLPPPINLLALSVLPFAIKFETKRLNKIYCKTVFVIFYGIPMLITFFIYNILCLPFSWIKGFRYLHNLVYLGRPFLNFGIWLVFGFVILVFIVFKDTY